MPREGHHPIEFREIDQRISIFSRGDVERGEININRETIVLPPALYRPTIDMTRRASPQQPELREVRFALFARRLVANMPNLIVVEGMISLGQGELTAVYPDESRLVAAERLLAEDPALMGIDMHTHPDHLQGHQTQFSYGDKQSLRTIARRDPGYRHVLVTGTHVLTYGENKPALTTKEIRGWDAIAKQRALQSRFDDFLRQGS